MPTGKVWIYGLLVFVCVCLYDYISAEDKKQHQILNGGSSASKAANPTFCGTLHSQKPKIGQIGEHVGHLHDVNNHHPLAPEYMTDVPFVKSSGA